MYTINFVYVVTFPLIICHIFGTLSVHLLYIFAASALFFATFLLLIPLEGDPHVDQAASEIEKAEKKKEDDAKKVRIAST